jgi:hypothetical protein
MLVFLIMNTKKLILLWEFYKSNFMVTLACFLFSFFMCPQYLGLFLSLFSIVFIYIHKEFSGKNEYYFYYNNQVSKKQLFFFCFLANTLISLFYFLIYDACIGSR